MTPDARLKLVFKASNPPTRAKALAELDELLARCLKRGDRRRLTPAAPARCAFISGLGVQFPHGALIQHDLSGDSSSDGSPLSLCSVTAHAEPRHPLQEQALESASSSDGEVGMQQVPGDEEHHEPDP